ncbi:MAG: hypothetical protein LWX83_05115 [Anaerolineae bacterium]|nr:hypothetical protein [Anaerolineae bacterium]
MAQSKNNNKAPQKRSTPEQRAQHFQRIVFAVLAAIIILSWIISLIAVP